VLRRLVNLACLLLFALWTVLGIPVLRDLSSNAVLASGAVLGALALVFQGLLRDFVAGLVLLLDDRYAIGDVVEIGGRTGEVVDVGVLSTELRSGAEVTLLLPRSIADLPGALALISDELAAFGADPRWAPKLLEPPRLLGIEAGQQGEARRALLGRLVERLQGWPRRAGELQGTNF
jgi:small conductance mechanosensitive channel